MKTLITLMAFGLGGTALAADHAEAPGAEADPAADIGDFYAWHTADGTIVAIVTLAAGDSAGTMGFDADTLTTIHIDNDLDNESDIDILVRFGQNTDGEWGVQFENVPGATGTLSGAVDNAVEDGSVKVYAGYNDDPFFFDITGFLDTLSTAEISFDATRDGFAGLNATVVAVEMDTATATASADSIQMWATTGRK